VHLPFCDTICYYCGCNNIVTKDHGRSARYLQYLARESKLVAEALEGVPRIGQMHWGGGTPTFLNNVELRELMQIIRNDFDLDPQAENSIEVDPRKVDAETVALLGELGLNRISVGVQDFNPDVQKAVNRIQSVEETRRVIEAARANGFKSVNMDLIYGLPKQTLAGFAATLELALECDPDRIALCTTLMYRSPSRPPLNPLPPCPADAAVGHPWPPSGCAP
jgi:oxygen-independent coproporphyrinogen III oxidase